MKIERLLNAQSVAAKISALKMRKDSAKNVGMFLSEICYLNKI